MSSLQYDHLFTMAMFCYMRLNVMYEFAFSIANDSNVAKIKRWSKRIMRIVLTIMVRNELHSLTPSLWFVCPILLWGPHVLMCKWLNSSLKQVPGWSYLTLCSAQSLMIVHGAWWDRIIHGDRCVYYMRHIVCYDSFIATLTWGQWLNYMVCGSSESKWVYR
jgi:hypothetical protein